MIKIIIIITVCSCCVVPFILYLAYPAEPSFCFPKCLMDKVNSGHYGRKSGQGFYIWEGDKALRVA